MLKRRVQQKGPVFDRSLPSRFEARETSGDKEWSDGQGQNGEQPADQQTVGMMVTDVLEAVTALGLVGDLILDLPVTLGHAEHKRGPAVEDAKFVAEQSSTTVPSGLCWR